MIASAFVILSLLSGSVIAANDWSVPCFNGECSYDTELGSLRIWGSPAAIADITNAGGWSILDCDPDALDQDIRVVCNDAETCNKLWNTVDPTSRRTTDPVGKLVRLPNSCGAMAFARIARVWDHKDQSIPEDVRRSLVRRAGEDAPVVQGVALDTNFDAIDPAKTGDVNIAIQGANIPSEVGNGQIVNVRRASHLRQARLFGFIENAFDKFNSFDKSVTSQLPPVNVDKTFNLFDQSISCPASGKIPAITAGLKADFITKANAVVTIGVAAEGTIVPPKLTSFGAFAGLDATFRGTLALKGSATGVADSGKLTFFEVGLPGLDFPGILTVGPSFKVQGQAIATLEVGVDMNVDLAYSISNAKLFFPKSDKQTSGGGFTADQSPLKLSATPSITAKGTIEAHLIPVIDMGISALGGIAKATIFLDLDASAGVTLTLNGEANASVDTTGATAAGASISGCAEVNGGFDVNAGADANFFGLFDKGTQVSLFSKDFQFFKKCFEQKTARSLAVPETHTLVKRFELKCPTADLTKVAPVANEQVAAQKRRSLPRFAFASR